MLYITDLDGTLFRDDATLSGYAKQTLADLLHAGVAFSIASARSIVSMKQIMGDLPLRLPVVAFNGAYVTDYHTGKHLVTHDFAPDVKADLLAFLLERDCPPFISGFDGRADGLYYSDIANEGMAWYRDDRTASGDPRLRRIARLSDALAHRIVCFTVIQHADARPDLQADLAKTFGDQVAAYYFENQYSPGWYWLTIHDPRATKANGICALRDIAGLSAIPLTVFGDNLNDLPMFDVADRAIAVENAQPALKTRADLVIGPNETDSVVRFIADETAGNAHAL